MRFFVYTPLYIETLVVKRSAVGYCCMLEVIVSGNVFISKSYFQ